MQKAKPSSLSLKRVQMTDDWICETLRHRSEAKHDAALEAAKRAFAAARAAKFVQLISETWILLLDCFAASGTADSKEYLEHVEGGFAWAETTPDDIEIWIFPALLPHLDHFGLTRYANRARAKITRMQANPSKRELGSVDLGDLHAKLNLDDLRAGRSPNPRATSLELDAARNWKHDEDSSLLKLAINGWRAAGREDRAKALEATLS